MTLGLKEVNPHIYPHTSKTTGLDSGNTWLLLTPAPNMLLSIHCCGLLLPSDFLSFFAPLRNCFRLFPSQQAIDKQTEFNEVPSWSSRGKYSLLPEYPLWNSPMHLARPLPWQLPSGVKMTLCQAEGKNGIRSSWSHDSNHNHTHYFLQQYRAVLSVSLVVCQTSWGSQTPLR